MKNLFFDMDGVLAKLENVKNWREVWLQENFFETLECYKGMEILEELVKSGEYNVYILSNSPTENADKCKIVWLQKHLPSMPIERIIINRGRTVTDTANTPIKTKAEVARMILNRELTENDILIDDYSGNLKEWHEAGGVPIKRKNGFNCKKGVTSTNYHKLPMLKSLPKLLKEIA